MLGGCTDTGPAEQTQHRGPAATEPAAATTAAGRWRPIAPAPIPPAAGMATVWTGTLLVAWGGQTPGGDGRAATAGAAYDPALDRWQLLPPAPIPGRFGARAVWSGREVLFWGGQSSGTDDATFADGAAYDPATRRWRALPPAPIGPRAGHEAVWTGQEMLVWGGYERCCPIDSILHDQAAAAYDPATDTWRTVAPVPPPWSGDDGSAVTTALDGRPFLWREGHLGALAAADDHWTEISAPPASPEPGGDQPAFTTTADPLAVGVATGDEIFVWSGHTGRLTGAAHRPGDPAAGGRTTATLAAQSGATVAAGGPGRIYAAAAQSSRVLEYRIAEDRWEDLPPAPIASRSFAALAWTGSEVLFWGGIGDEGPEVDGAMWHCC